jgi:hypothetical protein
MRSKYAHVFPAADPEAIPLRALYELCTTERARAAAKIGPSAEKLVQEFILAHRVTVCPPGYATASLQYCTR